MRNVSSLHDRFPGEAARFLLPALLAAIVAGTPVSAGAFTAPLPLQQQGEEAEVVVPTQEFDPTVREIASEITGPV